MKNLFVFFFLISSSTFLLGQFGNAKSKDVKKVMQYPLLVIKEVENPKFVKKLKRKKRSETLLEYQAMIADYNRQMENTITECWKYTDDITFKTWDEVAAMSKKSKKNYLVLYCARYSQSSYSGSYLLHDGLQWTHEYDDLDIDNLRTYYQVQIRIQPLKKFNSTRPFLELRLPTKMPTPAELTMGIHAVQHAMEYVTSKKEWNDFFSTQRSGEFLAERTLLIPKVSPKDKKLHTILKKIKKEYPFTIEEVTEEEMAKVIEEKDPTKAFLVMSPVASYFFEGWIIDVGTGKILARGDAEISKKEVKGTLFENLKSLKQ